MFLGGLSCVTMEVRGCEVNSNLLFHKHVACSVTTSVPDPPTDSPSKCFRCSVSRTLEGSSHFNKRAFKVKKPSRVKRPPGATFSKRVTTEVTLSGAFSFETPWRHEQDLILYYKTMQDNVDDDDDDDYVVDDDDDEN